MLHKILFIGFIVILFVGIGSYFIQKDIDSKNTEDKLVYQGPVPQGYNESYFRETGITKKIEVNNG